MTVWSGSSSFSERPRPRRLRGLLKPQECVPPRKDRGRKEGQSGFKFVIRYHHTWKISPYTTFWIFPCMLNEMIMNKKNTAKWVVHAQSMLRNDILKFIHNNICLSSVFSLIILQKFQSNLHKLYLRSVWGYSRHTGMKDKSTNIWLKPYISPFEATFFYFFNYHTIETFFHTFNLRVLHGRKIIFQGKKWIISQNIVRIRTNRFGLK